MAATKNMPENEWPFKRLIPVQRSIRLSLSLTGAATLALTNTPIQPVVAQEEDGSAADLGVMEINIKDAK